MSEQASRFWSFSLAVHSDAGPREDCLDLQDQHGIDVNMLLFGAFVGAVHEMITPERDMRAALAAVAPWNESVVSVLRKVRRALKSFAAEQTPVGPTAAVLRTSVKAAELEAERIEQVVLEGWGTARLGRRKRTEPGDAVAANIRNLLAICCAAARPTRMPAQLIAAAIAAVRVEGLKAEKTDH